MTCYLIVQKNQSLEILDLSWNGLSNTGVAAMGVALRVNKTLKVLDIRSVVGAHVAPFVCISRAVSSILPQLPSSSPLLTIEARVLTFNCDKHLLVPNHFEWFWGLYRIVFGPVRVQKLFHHLLLASTSQEIDTYTI